MHVGFDLIDEYPVKRTDKKDKRSEAAGLLPKTVLKALPDDGAIVIDSATTLSGIPAEAWSYRLANRTVIEWVLDAYKEKTPKDTTIKEEFNTYQFAA